MRRGARTLISALATVVGVAGCAAIVGIEDHTYDAGPAVSAACTAYCGKVAEACTDTHALYATTATCLGVCAKLEPGDDLEPAGNTVACRKKQAQRAIDTREPGTYCNSAGPGGAPLCADNCVSYCSLLQQTCNKEFGFLPDCPKACAALRDRGDFDLETDGTGDTIQCRLEHVSNANITPATHCPHAAIASSDYCIAPQKDPPDCAEFCRFNAAGCSGDLAAYESNAQCLAVCAALPPGTNGDREENTMGCRHWHTFNALIDPDSHCQHTAPGGDGHCGLDEAGKTGNCVAYCILAERACKTIGFDAKYASQAACQLDCSSQPDAFGAKHDSKYNLAAAATGNTLQCRLLHASRALTDVSECLSALGLGACQ
jgi:hypothetical protein